MRWENEVSIGQAIVIKNESTPDLESPAGFAANKPTKLTGRSKAKILLSAEVQPGLGLIASVVIAVHPDVANSG